LQVVVVLPTAVFGPGDVKPTTSSLLLAVAQGRVPGYVEGTINVVDGRDVAAGHVAAAKRGQSGQRYLLGGYNLTIREILTIASGATGRRPPGIKLPYRFVRAAAGLGGKLGIAGTHHLRAIDQWQPLDTSRTQAELGLSQPIPFEQTCRDTLDWFFENGYLKKKPVPLPVPEPADSNSQ
jgi:dihydroflavonol-4-reductase